MIILTMKKYTSINLNFSINKCLLSFIIGTFFNIYLFNLTTNINVKIIAGLWQFAILMQFIDFLAWTSECPSPQQKLSSRSGYILNILQPIAILLLSFLLKDFIDIEVKIISIIILIGYLSYILVNIPYSKDKECIKRIDECSHINYYWWNQDNKAVYVYLISVILLTILLIKPTNFAISQLIYVISTLILSGYFYGCGVSSIWCFSKFLHQFIQSYVLNIYLSRELNN
jgi:hypothetical protein